METRNFSYLKFVLKFFILLTYSSVKKIRKIYFLAHSNFLLAKLDALWQSLLMNYNRRLSVTGACILIRKLFKCKRICDDD